jgi:hypothetical protein
MLDAVSTDAHTLSPAATAKPRRLSTRTRWHDAQLRQIKAGVSPAAQRVAYVSTNPHAVAARAIAKRRSLILARKAWLDQLDRADLHPMRDLIAAAWAVSPPTQDLLGRASQGHSKPFYVATADGRVTATYDATDRAAMTVELADDYRAHQLNNARKALANYGPTSRPLNIAVATYVDVSNAILAAKAVRS